MGDDDKLDRTAARLMDDWRETNESWTQLIERIDAALRRAKAEVWRKAAIEARIESVRKDETSGYQRASRCLADTYDARAAQIEEGE